MAQIRGAKLSLAGGGYEAFTKEATVNPTVREDSCFVDAVDGSGDPALIRSDYADGLKSLAVTLAMNESARTGQVVRL